MAKTELLSPDVLRQLLRYEPETGRLFWRERQASMFQSGKGRYTADRASKIWHSKYCGMEAFGLDASEGYLRGSMAGHKVYAHRVIWAMQTGAWPADDIDHINGDRSDNSWVNLRSVPRRINAKNAKLRSTNTSGVMGVLQYGNNGKWRSLIMVDGKKIHLGCHDTFESASAARKAAESKYEFHANHGRP